MTKMSHPNSKQTIDVAPDQAANYESQGWVEKAHKAADPKPDRSKKS